MELVTEDQFDRLIENGFKNETSKRPDRHSLDFKPVVKLFCPWGAATWLLTEIDADDPDIAFGLCDLGTGHPEIGSVSLAEIAALRGPGGLRIERDLYFRASKTLTAYATEARAAGRILS